ncbi:MAG: transposase [Candidatus Hydrogenedentota bacterium]|nr:MAG: transposase [Candidatus Hydrogenedentota bacterium]
MPQSLSKIYVHIIFSTARREKILPKELLPELYAYLATVIKNLDCHAVQIGGTEDHIHILCVQSKNISTAKLVEEIKKPTSMWLKTKSDALTQFHWQSGYGAFSVSQSDVDRVREYIQNQEEHHRSRSFQDEFREFLSRYDVDFDEKYIWD